MSKTTSILVVDDNPSMTQTTADILSLHGYRVYLAYSGVEALQVLARENVDILLSDVVMPDMDGVVLYQQARQIHPRLIAFLMTAYSADEVIQRGMAEGIRTVLTKPLNLDLLLALIQAVEAAYLRKD